MSNEKLQPLAYIRWVGEQKLSYAKKAVLMQLALYSNDQGIAYPGVKRIAQAASISTRSVRDSLQSLIEGGYIERCSRHGGVGRRDAYMLLPLRRTAEEGNAPPAPQEQKEEQKKPERPDALKVAPGVFIPPITNYKRLDLSKSKKREGTNGSTPRFAAPTPKSPEDVDRFVRLFQENNLPYKIIVSLAKGRGYTEQEIEAMKEKART
jgi:DNA-binding MarR family transcriptional regulator